MTPDERKLLSDVRNAGVKIAARTRGRTVEQFLADEDVHVYDQINPSKVWDIVQDELPPLLARVDALLAGP